MIDSRVFPWMDSHNELVISILRQPTNLNSCRHLKLIHVHLICTGLHLTSSFAVGKFISRCFLLGLSSYACRVFGQMPQPNSFVWNNMIRGYQNNNQPQQALHFYNRMRAHSVVTDQFTFINAVTACADIGEYWKGKCVHGDLLRCGFGSDMRVCTSLIQFHSACGAISCARKVFDEMPVKDVVSWTMILLVYVNGRSADIDKARNLFDDMPTKDVVAWSAMIGAYVKSDDMGRARELFDKSPVSDLLMCNLMLGGYSKSGEIDGLLQLFEQMRCKDLVSWNTVISGLVQTNRLNEAMTFFKSMQQQNIKPSDITLVSILSGCAKAGALDIGTWVHSYIDKNSDSPDDVVVGTALIDMYLKCGALKRAQYVFDRLPKSNLDVAAWNAIINGFSMNGQSKAALDFFNKMLTDDNVVNPNEVTLVGVLTACAHGGLVKDGRRYFTSMRMSLGITPTIEHYGCMVDLLGRAGLLEEAYEFIKRMPLIPHAGIWGALLGACRIYGNVKLAECAMDHIMKIDSNDGDAAGYLAIMSNIYGSAGMWDEVERVRKTMAGKKKSKIPGSSVVEVNGVIHEFGAGDHRHYRSYDKMYALLDQLSTVLISLNFP